jgi:biopolymer transport protein ExbD
MLVAGLIELALSLFLSFIPVHFCQRVNEVLLRQTPRFYCSYELPDSRIAYRILRKSISFPLHIGFSKQQKDSTILVAYSNNRINPLRINNISKWVSENRASMDEMEYEQLTTELSIDKHAKMREVKRVMFQLRKSDARLIYFMVNKFGVGLPIRLRPICREILKADTSNQTINIPCSDVKSYRSKNTVVLEILNDKVFYQNEAIDNSVTDSIKSSIAKFKGDLQFDVFVDDTSQYKTFVYLLENIRLAYHQVWLNLAKERYGLTLSANDLAPNDYNLDLPEEIKEIKREYAINFFIWSDEEIEYFKLKLQK